MTLLRDAKRSFLEMSTVNQGIVLALLTGLVSGVSVFLNGYAIKHFDSATSFTTFKNVVVGAVLVLAALRSGAARDVKRLSWRNRGGLAALGLIGGSLPFVLFFEGLSRVESGNAAFIHKTLFLWVAVLAVVLLRERLGWPHLAALGLLLASQLLLGGPGSLALGTGTAMVLIATLLWSAEVILAKRLLGLISSTLGAAGRMGIGAALMVGYVAVTGNVGSLFALTVSQLAWGLLTAAFLLAYVTTWYAALRRAPATTVACVLTVGAPITAALSVIAGRGIPDAGQIIGYTVLAIAVVLLVRSADAHQPHIATERGA